MSGRPKGTVRIVGGAHRGRRLSVPVRSEVRPTGAMVREAVFDVLGPVDGLSVLDLFAGTGALGLEALSRGARACVFVESDREAGAVLRSNIAALDYRLASRVVAADYRKAVNVFKGCGERFDLLFVDPPYRMLAEVEATLTPVMASIMSVGGLMVVEGPRSVSAVFGASPVFEREYGDTRITMLRSKE